MERALNIVNFNAETTKTDVVLKMPKFKIESTYSLKDALKSVGCDLMFSDINCVESLGEIMQVTDVV